MGPFQARFLGTAAWIGFVAGIGLAGPAWAQSGDTTSAPVAESENPNSEAAVEDGGTGGPDIVVTATKRATTLQRTPMALSAISGETLSERGVYSVSQLATITPSIAFGEAGGGNASIITLRGVSGRDVFDTGYSAVAVNFDDVFISRPTGLNASFYDLERIEVLRGPQGTLYGRNATAGVINIISKKPVLGAQDGYFSVESGNYKTVDADGAVNLPIGDTVAVRASFVSRYHEGFRDNGPAGHGDDMDAKGGRLQLLFKPTRNLEILLGASYLHLGGIGTVFHGVPFVRDAAGVLTTVPTESPFVAQHFDLNTRGFVDSDQATLTARISYDFGPISATYIGAYNRLHYRQLWDNDAQALPIVAFTFMRNERNRDQSHELRLVSNGLGRLDLQGGLYYFKGEGSSHNMFDKLNGRVPVNLREYFYDFDSESFGVFGQAGFDVTDGLRLSAGVRYSSDKAGREGPSYVGALGQDVTDGIAERTFMPSTPQLASSSKITWHAGADYTIDRDHLIYAKVDTGYKQGGSTGFGGFLEFQPETITAYEVGSKNQFLGRTLQANLTGFYYDYTNQQVSQNTELFGGITTNAGKSRIYGVELEAVAEPIPAGRLDVSVTYLSATYTKFTVANGAINVALDGNRAIQAPKWAANAGYEHRFDTGAGSLTLRAQTEYKSHQYFSFFNRGEDRMKAYTRSDLSAEFQPAGSQLKVQAFVRNLENTVVLTNADSSAAIYGATRYNYAAPRTYGFRLRYDW